MGRSPCCDKVGLKKGPWTSEEDQKLLAYIDQHGHGSWRSLPIKAGLQRCGKSCRLRWTNYLRPDIKRGKFSLQEEQTITQLHALLGNRWSAIATHLAKRTDNEIKNYWNTHLKKRLMKMGIDPVTHKPKSDALISNNRTIDGGHSKSAANLSHMAQWESARLEAEARLVRESRLRSNLFQTPQNYRQNSNISGILFVNNAVGLDLESPSSTLRFPGAKAIMSASESRCCSEYLLESSGGSGGEGDPVVMKETWTPESMREDHEDHHNGFVVMDTNNVDDQAGFTELLLRNTTVVGGEDDEENKNYWNTILDLVNTSPSDDSPIF